MPKMVAGEATQTVGCTRSMEQMVDLIRQYRESTDPVAREAFGCQFFDLVRPRLYAYICCRCPKQHAEDVCQQTLLGIFTNLHQFHGMADAQLCSWCYRVARNKIADHYRKANTKRGGLVLVAPEELWKAIENSAIQDPPTKEQWADLEDTLALLKGAKPECYEYLVEVFVFNESRATLAQKLGLTYDQMRMRVQRCVESARELMAKVKRRKR